MQCILFFLIIDCQIARSFKWAMFTFKTPLTKPNISHYTLVLAFLIYQKWPNLVSLTIIFVRLCCLDVTFSYSVGVTSAAVWTPEGSVLLPHSRLLSSGFSPDKMSADLQGSAKDQHSYPPICLHNAHISFCRRLAAWLPAVFRVSNETSNSNRERLE